MEAFAALLDRLVLTPPRNAKLRLLADYFRRTPDPDRGYALAALTGELHLPSVKPAMLRALVAERIDEVLFWYSYDYVGDFAETLALVWQPNGQSNGHAQPAEDLAGSAEHLENPQGSLELIVEASLRGVAPAPVAEVMTDAPLRLSTVVERLLAASRSDGP